MDRNYVYIRYLLENYVSLTIYLDGWPATHTEGHDDWPTFG